MFKNESLLRNLYHNYISHFGADSYSQEGEDRILARIFEGKKNGFYIDIGAHHPFRFSNTYLFYKQGWTGINIEANPDALKLFNKFRSKDKNLNVAVGTGGQSLVYYKFDEPALNSFDEKLSDKRNQEGWRISGKISIPIHKLSTILEENLNPKQKIDFMSIDVEGLDLEVIKSNDWKKYRPTFILVECLNSEDIFNDPIYKHITENLSYRFYAKAVNTLFMKDALSK